MKNELARAIEISAAIHSPSANDQMRKVRTDDITQIPHFVKRNTMRGIDWLCGKDQRIGALALTFFANNIGGMEYLGNGAWSSVYRNDDTVLKVHRGTALMSDQERLEYLKCHIDDSRNTQSILGKLVLPQELTIEEHPFGKYTVVVARQPFIRGEPINFVHSSTPHIDTNAIHDYIENSIVTPKTLTDFVDATFCLDDTHSLVPDINGYGNFIASQQGELCLIDSDPVAKEHFPCEYDMILRQADNIGRFVDRYYG
jgi:hypothetical protein